MLLVLLLLHLLLVLLLHPLLVLVLQHLLHQLLQMLLLLQQPVAPPWWRLQWGGPRRCKACHSRRGGGRDQHWGSPAITGGVHP